jgi:hypothetical protein
MNISDLIKLLEEYKAKHGNIPVRVETLSHTWAPDPVIKKAGEVTYLVLNG